MDQEEGKSGFKIRFGKEPFATIHNQMVDA